MISKYRNPIDAIQDSITRRFEIAQVREQNRRIKDVEFTHFKNVVSSRLGSDPVVARVISTWRAGKDPAYCQIQIINCKNWSAQEMTDIQMLYVSFKHFNEEIWDVERKYGNNPRVRALIDSVRKGDDFRVVPFEIKLQKIIKEEM